jgi:hypothetical protein
MGSTVQRLLYGNDPQRQPPASCRHTRSCEIIQATGRSPPRPDNREFRFIAGPRDGQEGERNSRTYPGRKSAGLLTAARLLFIPGNRTPTS